MALLHRLHPLLHGALVVVAIVAMAMVIMVVAVREMQEVISSRQGDAMTVYDGNEAKVCMCGKGTVMWAASVAAWCLGGGGHNGNGNSNNGSCSESNTRGHIVKVGQCNDSV